MKRKCRFGMLCAAALLMLCACSGIELRRPLNPFAEQDNGSAEPDTEPQHLLYLGIMLKDLDNPYFLRMKAGAEDAADEIGAAVMVVAPDNERNRKEQKAMLETLAEMDLDVLALSLLDEAVMEDELKLAHDNGTIIMAVDTPLRSKYSACYVGTHQYNAAYKQGICAAALCGGSGYALILRGSSNDYSHDLREDGLKKGLQDGGIDNTAVIADDKSTEVFGEDLRDTLLQHPDITVICATKDKYALAAQAILDEFELHIPIVSFDGMEEVTEDVYTGSIAAVIVQDPYLIGKRCVQRAAALYQGEPLTENLYIGTELILSDNAETMQEE